MRLAVDWDGTCVENVWPSRSGEWKPGAVQVLRDLVESGWEVVVHTCRIAPVLASGRTRPTSAVDREIRAIRRRLDDAGLGMVGIHTGAWKPAAHVYLDDRAIRFTTWDEARKALWQQQERVDVPDAVSVA